MEIGLKKKKKKKNCGFILEPSELSGLYYVYITPLLLLKKLLIIIEWTKKKILRKWLYCYGQKM